MDLKEFIYVFNLMTTLTVTDRKELCYLYNEKINKEIDYSNSINFYELVKLFNKCYLLFKNDYEKLEKIDFGEYIQFFNFNKTENNRYLGIYIYGPNSDICDKGDTTLYLIEENNTIHSYITNDINPFSKDYYWEEIQFDNNILKKYLDFVEKYDLFLSGYYNLKNQFIYGDGTTVLFSKINGDIFNKLENFEFHFGNLYFNTEDFVDVFFKLGEEFAIDYDSSKIILHDKEILDSKKENIDKLINGLYVNRSKLSPMYEKGKTLIKERK